MNSKPLFPNQTVTAKGDAPSQDLTEIIKRIVGDLLANETAITAAQTDIDAILEGRTFLASDTSTTSTAIADITGLSFPVVSGQRYHFTFVIYFVTAATTDGIRLSTNGPTTARLVYDVRIPTGATTQDMFLALNSYDLPATPTATRAAGAATSMAIIKGFILPTADGTLVARYASEIGSNTTIRAGSYVEWFRG